jgi:hypothetical protein
MSLRPLLVASSFFLAAPALHAQTFTAIYAQQTQWVASKTFDLDIRYVSHYGDVVNHGDDLVEWANADVAMTTLDVLGIPYGVTAGNHDITPSAVAGSSYIPANFRTCFGAQRFAGNHGYRGDSPSGMSSYQLFDAHGVQFLALHFECDAALQSTVTQVSEFFPAEKCNHNGLSCPFFFFFFSSTIQVSSAEMCKSP